ncbi:hypothetical protein RHMOL_Rhmol07G0039300 [Rhododendron molle]|uniref:Uncharacterized protein n=1 Tax=Rhododendron molle TaxID=49168 RepID=A0ACC0MWS8_RHOML|nr:hypothetical protein RHMOL_Rhmol07G0039300 [Rhododendron molle]
MAATMISGGGAGRVGVFVRDCGWLWAGFSRFIFCVLISAGGSSLGFLGYRRAVLVRSVPFGMAPFPRHLRVLSVLSFFYPFSLAVLPSSSAVSRPVCSLAEVLLGPLSFA